MKVAALCAGYGGLEMGLEMAGVDVELSWYAEIDKNAASVMSHHHPDAPNLGDLTEITDPPPVDIVTAGFPCQPVSVAGKRQGVNDERWLIDDVCRIARESGADWLILENVGGLLSANDGDAMARVVAALAANGFAAEWTCVRASDVGAPHRRLRWFCVAYTDGDRSHELPSETNNPSRKVSIGNGPQGRTRNLVGNSYGEGWPGLGAVSERTDKIVAGTDGMVVGGVGAGFRDRCGGVYEQAIVRWEQHTGRVAPLPTDEAQRLNPRFVEWMMGLPAGHVTDVIVNRTKALKCLGNGVVPQQAAYAIQMLQKQMLEKVAT